MLAVNIVIRIESISLSSFPQWPQEKKESNIRYQIRHVLELIKDEVKEKEQQSSNLS